VIMVGRERLAERIEEFVAVGFSKIVLVPTEEADSWEAEIEDLASLIDLQAQLSS